MARSETLHKLSDLEIRTSPRLTEDEFTRPDKNSDVFHWAFCCLCANVPSSVDTPAAWQLLTTALNTFTWTSSGYLHSLRTKLTSFRVLAGSLAGHNRYR
ncbi:hypothetical protein AHF37_11011 [Paragonimus kellicotti]|nr:hypothetical protein AHF37_11011 [Paragonimus kellicotti]